MYKSIITIIMITLLIIRRIINITIKLNLIQFDNIAIVIVVISIAIAIVNTYTYFNK